MAVAGAVETPSLTGEFAGGTHRVLECTQAHTPGNQHRKGHSSLVASEGNDIKWGDSSASSIVPFWMPLPKIAPQHSEVVCPALANT